MSALRPENVEWIVNSNGELGVKIGDLKVFLYKGRSLEYPSTPERNLQWRHVGKREFGECCHPRTMSINGSSMPYTEGDGWKPLSEDAAKPTYECDFVGFRLKEET